MTADEELHQHYTELLRNSGVIIYGRITYQLMERNWPAIVKNPTGDKSMDDFAVAIDNIPKIVFSKTLKKLEWKSATLATLDIKEEVCELKENPGKDILVGSRSLIVALMNLNLIDECQLCVHPVVIGNGLPLFQNINDRIVFKLLKTKTFGSGAVVHYYAPGDK
jgi:dihydrofolate reductase